MVVLLMNLSTHTVHAHCHDVMAGEIPGCRGLPESLPSDWRQAEYLQRTKLPSDFWAVYRENKSMQEPSLILRGPEWGSSQYAPRHDAHSPHTHTHSLFHGSRICALQDNLQGC